jgi:hypothetical protein
LPITRVFWTAVLAAAALAAGHGAAHAGGWRHGRPERNQVDPRRGQVDYIRAGLGPGLQPYTRQGHWGWDHRYPKYPLFHGPVPAGPGDCLYETGLFPWQRG